MIIYQKQFMYLILLVSLLTHLKVFGYNNKIQFNNQPCVDSISIEHDSLLNICKDIYIRELINEEVLIYYLDAMGLKAKYEKQKIQTYPFSEVVFIENIICKKNKVLITVLFAGSTFYTTFFVDLQKNDGVILGAGLQSEQCLQRDYLNLIKRNKLVEVFSLETIIRFLTPLNFSIEIIETRKQAYKLINCVNSDKIHMLFLVNTDLSKLKIMDFTSFKWRKYKCTNVNDHHSVGEISYYKSIRKFR